MTPNYQNILHRLTCKVLRNHDYYRMIASHIRHKASHVCSLEERIALEAQADSLERCAKDMKYTAKRTLRELPSDDVLLIEKMRTEE